ncbi:MAG: family 78 glycoside hydrolase catalytic domain [Saonia sp.]
MKNCTRPIGSLFLGVLFFALFSCSDNSDAVVVEKLSVEYLENPLGIDETKPRLNWILHSEGRGKSQSAYRILVAGSQEALSRDQGDLWDSEKENSSATKQVEYLGKPLTSGQHCYWKVKVWDENDRESPWSAIGTWSMGLLKRGDWKSKWIGFKTKDLNEKDTLYLPPSPYLRKSFTLKGKVKKASLHVSALGLLEISLNGSKIGDDLFVPGWTDYDKRVYYKTYDITKELKEGKNALGAILADGWYCGYIGPYSLGRPRNREFYGKNPGLLCQLKVTYENGDTQVVISDESWKANTGPIVYADLLMGESYNANLAYDGWNLPEFNDADWENAYLHGGTKAELQWYPGNSIKVYDELETVTVSEPKEGIYMFDLGQNFAGHARLKIKGDKNDTIVLRYGEMLHPDGTLMTENLRFARATDTYILKGGKTEIWEPRFTYHGFRYVEVSGLKLSPKKEMITGVAVSSATPRTSNFISSDSLLNKLYNNIIWTQRSNFMDVPTDSPQRDERLGWLGDAQIFSKSALYNCNLGGFYKKWLVDVADAQYDFGPYANFAPRSYPELVWYSPGWMEAGIMVPYNLYTFYGDTRIIEKHYESMTRFMDYCIAKTNGKYFYPENSWTEIAPKGGFGDWLSLTDKNLAHDLMASIYFANAVRLMAEMSKAIGKEEKAGYYQNIFEEGTKNFVDHYMDESGRFKIDEAAYGNGEGYFEGEKGFTGHTQTAYASAIYFDVLTEDLKQKASGHLAALIKAAKRKPTAGILGIRQLLPGLSKVNRSDLAYELLLNKAYPGWGFEIENGATTIWERWNSYTHEKGFNGEMNAKMNSFNHYAFGAVSEYLFSSIAGIETKGVGFDQIIIRPDYGNKTIDKVSAEYSSINGKIKSSWQIKEGTFSLEVSIPVNTTAKVYIPSKQQGTIKERDVPIDEETFKPLGREGNYEVFSVASGTYFFESQI